MAATHLQPVGHTARLHSVGSVDRLCCGFGWWCVRYVFLGIAARVYVCLGLGKWQVGQVLLADAAKHRGYQPKAPHI